MPAARSRPGVTKAVVALGDSRAHPDVAWLKGLLGVGTESVEAVLKEVAELELIEQTIHSAHVEGGREFYAQFRAPFELYALTRLLRPDHIVETGVSSGVSSAHFLLGTRRNGLGTLHSIDFPVHQRAPTLAERESPVALPPGRATGWAVPTELVPGWDLRLGPSQELLPPLVHELPSIGLFLHDSLHTPSHLTFELTTIRPKLTPGAVVLADNTEWTGKAFDRFADSLGVGVFRRGGSDLVGLRMPLAASPKKAATPTRSPRATRTRKHR